MDRSRVLAVALATALVTSACGTPSPTQAPVRTTPPAASPSPSTSAVASAVAAEPKVVCQPDTSTWNRADAGVSQVPIAITLTCENAVAAAKAIVGPDPAVAYIEFAFGRWCPPGALCALALPNTGHVVFHRKGRLADLIVGVTADESGRVTATHPVPLPSPSPA